VGTEDPLVFEEAAEHVLLFVAFGRVEETARGEKAVVEAEAARSNQEEKCRNFMLWEGMQ